MKIVNAEIIDGVFEKASKSKRLRMNYNIHEALDEPVHKLLNALQLGTKLPIHRHLHPPKKETIVLLKGSVLIEKFDDEKKVLESYELSEASGNVICEIYPDEWHTYKPLENNALVLGIKEGPYLPYCEEDLLM